MINPIQIHIEVGLSGATVTALQGLFSRAGLQTRAASSDPERPSGAPEKPSGVPAAAPDGPVTDERLREAVKAAKDATSAADVRAVFKDFGIRASIDCPAARRRELLDRLTTLAS